MASKIKPHLQPSGLLIYVWEDSSYFLYDINGYGRLRGKSDCGITLFYQALANILGDSLKKLTSNFNHRYSIDLIAHPPPEIKLFSNQILDPSIKNQLEEILNLNCHYLN
ncbi:MAG TPA: hypothetical protein VJC39_04770 [Candidatus Nanoarchaeia archaeon]|nr:hypothetical protein [Candidatus Nanoarchaeia archaeon]